MSLDIIKRNRDSILKAELASLIALWDKIDPNKQNKSDISITFSSLNDWENLLKGINIAFSSSNNDDHSFDLWENFLKDWRRWRKNNDPKNILQILFGTSENLNSGIDKGSPKEKIKANKRWIANAFGGFKEYILYVNENKSRVEALVNSLIDEIKDTLLHSLKKSDLNIKDIKNTRDKICILFNSLLSDDRFPINDITLWDQAYTATSMFKSSLSDFILQNKDFNKLPNHGQIKWRILGIQYDKMGLAEKGFKLASIRWYRNISREIDDAIKELIEVEYPIGNEIYRDETGIYFIVGECLGDDSKGNSIVPLKQEFKELEDKVLEIFKEKTNDEFYPAIYLTKASRGLMNLTTLLEKAKENFLKANWKQKSLGLSPHKEDSGRGIGVCPICKTRLIYEKDKENKNDLTICKVCNHRIYRKQVESWIRNKSKETIWTDEIKGNESRVSYVSFSLSINPWINGNLINTLITRKLEISHLNAIKDTISLLSKPNSKLSDGKIKNYIWGVPKSLKVRQFIESWLLERLIEYKWEKFFKAKLSNHNLVDFSSRKILWNRLNQKDLQLISEITIQFLLRKQPSPARIRRIWETTKTFFENIHERLEDILEIPEWRRKRLVWRVKKTEELKQITKNEVEKDGILFWIQPENNYMEIYLISSIDDFLEKYDKKGTLKELLNIREPDLEDVRNALETFSLSLQVSEKEKIEINADNLSEIQHYKPFSLITDISPVNYQVIIPTEYTQNLIDKVIELYNKNFKYVYGKLPLHIGVVTSYYKKPLYVSLKALRKIRRDNINPDKLWQKKNINEFCQLQRKKLKHATTEELINQTEEYYSLYFDNPDKKDYQFYIKPDENWKKWISTISEFPLNSQVEMIPNTFDFEFMDTNTRRNDIFYDEENHYKRALPLKSNRPYELEIYWPKFKEFYEIFKDKNKSAKLHRLIELLYEKVQNYNEAFKPLLASAFVNILELRKDNETLERIRKIFDLNTELDILKALEEKLTEENLKLFIDMFEFGHTALKEV